MPVGRRTAWSRDGKLVAVVDRDEAVQVLDDTGRLLRRVEVPGERGAQGVRSLAFSPDGRLLATGRVSDRDPGADKTPAGPSVQLWDVATGKMMRGLRPDRFAAESLVFSPDGRLLATSTWRGPTSNWEPSPRPPPISTPASGGSAKPPPFFWTTCPAIVTMLRSPTTWDGHRRA